MKLFVQQKRRALLLAVVLAIATQPATAQQSQYYTGNGGKGMSLTIYVPQSTGLEKDQSYVPALVQGEFVSNFSNYSAISILDWERLDDIYVKLTDEAYDDKADAKQDVVLGRLAPTSHFLTGNITKTATGYNIKMNITATADKMVTATYSGTFAFAELDNLTGVRRASLELLQKVGVELTEKARQELAGAAGANQISAQTALARGVTAQRQGTEVTALNYYYQAASFNPALKEAVKRSSVIAANISSGNIGADIRNDILWRKNWVSRLKETEEAVSEMIRTIMANAGDPPYTMIYIADIKTGNVNYQTETADLSINAGLLPNMTWFKALGQTLRASGQATKAVLDGLNTTDRKKEWGLAGWPKAGVSNVNPFAKDSPKKKYDITVVLELVNQSGRVIGHQTVRKTRGFTIKPVGDGQFNIEYTIEESFTISFKGVRANDISDNLTIRVASVNGMPPEQARFTITASASVAEKSWPFTDGRDGKKYNTVRIGGKTWMAENINANTRGSWCYENKESNCAQYGRLYTWNTAMGVCPDGWSLPSQYDWDYLVEMVGGKKVAGKKLKASSGWNDNGNGTDEYGFSALPGGYHSTISGRYADLGSHGLWATTHNSPKHISIRDEVYEYNYGHDRYSVRCVFDGDKLDAPPPVSASVAEKSWPFTDGRDGKKYNTVRIDGKTWMAENLNIKTEDSYCYENNESNCAKYGRLYTWNAAKTACPAGWHLPSRKEWDDLAGGSSAAGKKLKSKSGWNDFQGKDGNGSDAYGFSALPGGGRGLDSSFGGIGILGNWWAATGSGGSLAYFRNMGFNSDYVFENNNNGGIYGFSVRCVVDGDKPDAPPQSVPEPEPALAPTPATYTFTATTNPPNGGFVSRIPNKVSYNTGE